MALELGEEILKIVNEKNEVDTLELAKDLNQEHQKIIGAVKSVQSLGELITVEQKIQTKWELTSEGKTVSVNGSHEALVFNAIPDEGIEQAEIMKTVPNAKVGFSKAMSAGWIVVDKTSGKPIVKKKMDKIEDIVRDHLKNISENKENVIPDITKQDYKKRKLIQEITIKSFVIRKGPEFSLSVEKLETDLNIDLLTSGAWKEKKFKDYNFDALGVQPAMGALHPLMRVRAELCKIFTEMGFVEMATNNYVESCFWNFDALFVPQKHPARDAQDTFYISNPATCSKYPQDYKEKVKKVHSVGAYGSLGYQCEWKEEEASRNVLRTHTTAVSARMLHKLGQEGQFRPVKYFSIDKVFRNETLDATHLAEFHQVEGVVADHNISLGDLMGILYEFFKKLGLEGIKFKPAYNPYTEPSMEIFSYHKGLGKWIEVGNSGIFRPELTLPAGLPEDVRVLGWGLSLERPTMIKYGITNIRDLVGPKVDLQMVHYSPICRLDK